VAWRNWNFDRALFRPSPSLLLDPFQPFLQGKKGNRDLLVPVDQLSIRSQTPGRIVNILYHFSAGFNSSAQLKIDMRIRFIMKASNIFCSLKIRSRSLSKGELIYAGSNFPIVS
jgi:hypothetical protein